MRAFIAIELPGEVKRQLGDHIAALRAGLNDRVVRWSNPDTTHLTLRFIGDIDGNQLAQVKEAMDQAVAGIPSFDIHNQDALGCFPAWNRPRVFWIGLEGSGKTLSQLNHAIERELRERGFAPERRPFHPHLTIGRAQRGAGGKEMADAAQLLRERRLSSVGTVSVTQISLMQSDLRPTGAVHTQIYTAALDARSK